MKILAENGKRMGTILAALCLYAVIRYAMLPYSNYGSVQVAGVLLNDAEATALERCVIAVLVTFNMFSVFSLVWSIFRKGKYIFCSLAFVVWQYFVTTMVATFFNETIPTF